MSLPKRCSRTERLALAVHWAEEERKAIENGGVC